MNKPNVILLHGRWPEKIDEKLIKNIPLCDPNNEGNWMGWVKKQLIKLGYSINCPIVADVWKARYKEWEKVLNEEEINENTILVGHSAGGYAILRYLGESGKKVKKVILVAPGAPGMDRNDCPLLPFEEEFYEYKITSELNSQIIEGVVVFVSDDWDFILRAVEKYKKELSAKEIIIKDKGHFSFLIPELPELLDEILSE